jgi:hypothetical protein
MVQQKPVLLSVLSSAVFALLLLGSLLPLYAQDSAPPRVQQIAGRIHSGTEMHVYRVADLAPGDTLHVYMQTASGNLDPLVGVLEGSADLQAVHAQYLTDLQALIAAGGDIAPGLEELRQRTFLAWDDDGGQGYAAALAYPVTAGGDYWLLAGGSLSALGRATSGAYTLTVAINSPEVLTGEAKAAIAPEGGSAIAVLDRQAMGVAPRVSEITGTISADHPTAVLQLADFDPGDTVEVFVAATGDTTSTANANGSLRPQVILRDYGAKPLAAANLGGQATTTTLEYQLAEGGSGYTVEITGAPGADGAPTSGEYQAVVGFNAPTALQGEPVPGAPPSLLRPVPVQVGVKIDRISEVDSAGEDFTVIGSLRMDWQDPDLAFSPDTCNCSIKLYTEKEFDRFLAEVRSRWPDFTFYNQQGNRWAQNRAAAVWPDGSARYVERFTATFQADFDFTKYPFDTQEFPIALNMILPNSVYELTPLPDYSGINPEHGEDEFIVGPMTIEPGVMADSAAADRQVATMTFSFEAPRHLEYYTLQVFVPILLIILISWFTFFLKDYTRRIEAAAANILLFIAFSFSLAGNYPRLGYITFLDAVMAVTFVVNTLVLLYNVQMKRMETKGEVARVERIDRFFDWAYPLSYIVLIGLVVLLFFGPQGG